MFFIYYQFLSNSSGGLSWHVVYLVPVLLNLILLALSFSIILSNIYIIAKDITQIWAVVIGIGFWLSPILYKLDVFRQAMPSLEYLNPISGIIINARNVTLYNRAPDWNTFWFDMAYALCFLFLGLILMNKLGSKASEKL
jgi:ABC-type polysaccharide/polyol phosphate export permease